MPQLDANHTLVKQALIRDGWRVTHDPYKVRYEGISLYIDMGAQKALSEAEHAIAIEIKEFGGNSAITDLYQAIGQYATYRLLLARLNIQRSLYLGISDATDATYGRVFDTSIGRAVITDMTLQLLIIDLEAGEIKQWIHPTNITPS